MCYFEDQDQLESFVERFIQRWRVALDDTTALASSVTAVSEREHA